ncbi:hypothetical protein NLJ89_g2897 [Agrocybe chaxingu]|uniref:Uncharacterized protein n=1 Tax=Agrocybe chaxingu TaxID=84603 RepID=A0A9W8K5Y5_9AGAR|nr:hypothetical protein NLJ89_g2897 [Agrocybe chaxingu]
MLAVSTADVGVTLHSFFRFILQGRAVPAKNTYPKRIFLVSNNTIAGCLIVLIPMLHHMVKETASYRLPLFVALLYIELWFSVFDTHVPPFPRPFPNLFVDDIRFQRARRDTDRTARSIVGVATARRCLFIFALIVWSGIIYPIYLLLDLVVDTIVIDAGLIQVVCIAPALMVVQVGLTRYTQEAQTDIAMQHVEQQQSNSTPVLDSVFSTVGTAGGGGNTGGGAPTVPPSPHQSQTQVPPPQEEERHDNDDV